jgi:hypothetical protein
MTARTATLGDKLTAMAFDAAANEVVITGANLQIVNGLGNIKATNGLGSLIVGYKESRTDDRNCRRSCTDLQTGSHNVVGKGNNFLRSGEVVVGHLNEISSNFASSSGGDLSIASGERSWVSGGVDNRASGEFAVVSGGNRNIASGGGSSDAKEQYMRAAQSYGGVEPIGVQPIHFDYLRLEPTGRHMLDKVADKLRESRYLTVAIEDHTGTDLSNFILWQQRTEVVKAYMANHVRALLTSMGNEADRVEPT